MLLGRNLKLILMAAYFSGAAYFGYTNHYIIMSILLVLGGLATYSLIANGSVAHAMKEIEKQDFTKARKYLSETINVNWLTSTYRAYYYMADGTLLVQAGSRNEAIDAYEKCLQNKIKKEDDKAVIYFQLSMLYADKGNVAKSRILLKACKDLNPKGKIVEEIKKFEKRIR